MGIAVGPAGVADARSIRPGRERKFKEMLRRGDGVAKGNPPLDDRQFAAAGAGGDGMDPASLTKARFAGWIGRTFRALGSAGEPVEIELIEVTRLDDPAPRPFALLFRGPRNPLLVQEIHRLESDGAGLDLFLVPVGPDREGRHLYEAVFS